MMVSGDGNARPILWVEDLNVVSFIKILILRCFYPFQKVFYSTSNASIRQFAQKYLSACFMLENAFLCDSRLTPHEEMLLSNNSRKSLHEFLENEIKVQRFFEPILSFLNTKYDRTKVALYLKQQIAIQLEPQIRLMAIIRFYRDHNSSQNQHMVLVKDHAWCKYLKNIDSQLELHTYSDFQGFLYYFYHFFKIVIEMLMVKALFLLERRPRRKNEVQPARIAVFYAQGLDLDKKTDYFWFPNSQIDPKQIIVYFLYKNRPLTPDLMELIKKNGMSWINLISWRWGYKRIQGSIENDGIFPNQEYQDKLKVVLVEVSKMFKRCLKESNRESLDLWRHITALQAKVCFFESFFKECNIKIHFALHEADLDMSAANIAMDIVGGIDCSTHWSNYDVVDIRMGKPHDVYFTWGPYFPEKVFNQPFYLVQNYVQTGYLYDSFFERRRAKANEYRQLLLEKGVKFVICFYDQNNPEVRPLWNQEVEKFYRALLQLLNDDKEVGLILKPKKRSPMEKIPTLKPILDCAVSEGRCLILRGDIFPNEAAQASEIAIGLSATSSPCVESALAGVKTFTYDLESLNEHFLYKTHHNRVVFDDLPRLIESIKLLKNKSRCSNDLGIYDNDVIAELDPFRDGKAALRVGGYIKELLKGFEMNLTKSEIILNANRKFISIWGINRISIKES